VIPKDKNVLNLFEVPPNTSKFSNLDADGLLVDSNNNGTPDKDDQFIRVPDSYNRFTYDTSKQKLDAHSDDGLAWMSWAGGNLVGLKNGRFYGQSNFGQASKAFFGSAETFQYNELRPNGEAILPFTQLSQGTIQP
jgi:hypothetical protein